MESKTYVHKPTEVEAVQVTAETTAAELNEFIGGIEGVSVDSAGEGFVLTNEEGERNVVVGDYLIKGILNKVYPCSAEVFEESYSVKE